MATFDERPDSGSLEFSGDQPSYVTRWNVIGEDDQNVAYAIAVASTSTAVDTEVGTLNRQGVGIEPAGPGHYIATVTYGRRSGSSANVGSMGFSFDTMGSTATRKAALVHIASYPDGAPDHKGAIGVDTKNGTVEGAEVVIPALRMTYTFRHPQGVVDELYAKQMARLTGCTNLLEFRTFQPEELLFLGATGSDGTDAEAEVAYHMLASENTDSLTIGEIVDIVKRGQHYLWIEFEESVSADNPVIVPKAVHIEQTMQPISFADYLGWS
jgi:hypothetical protein